ncbi:MAG: hypothetical protein P0111_04425 [Nitrospira sp.]|nr:hypothetical protein [Nitrospira sp.]
MEFITFHVRLASYESVHPNQSMGFEEQVHLIRMMFNSVRYSCPGAIRTLLTNIQTSDVRLPLNCRRVTGPVNAKDLMLERAIAQERYLLASDMSTPMVLLDSDILLNGSLAAVFRRPFDVALTWRPNQEMPINGGLILLNNVRPDVTRTFFTRYVAIYKSKYAQQATWFGDQLALRDCVGLSIENMGEQIIIDHDGCRVLLLPCDTYNFSPRNHYRAICTSLPDKVVLHFKGQRKRLMAPFWRAWLRPAHSRLPWIRFMGWRERRVIAREAEQERQGTSQAMRKQTQGAA